MVGSHVTRRLISWRSERTLTFEHEVRRWLLSLFFQVPARSKCLADSGDGQRCNEAVQVLKRLLEHAVGHGTAFGLSWKSNRSIETEL